jgi:hypothetical protein
MDMDVEVDVDLNMKNVLNGSEESECSLPIIVSRLGIH